MQLCAVVCFYSVLCGGRSGVWWLASEKKREDKTCAACRLRCDWSKLPEVSLLASILSSLAVAVDQMPALLAENLSEQTIRGRYRYNKWLAAAKVMVPSRY